MNSAEIARATEAWFLEHQRDLPWRRTVTEGRRDPYTSLVSEFMLQQTQVSRVLEKFGPFIQRFPDVRTLAGASEDDVLAHWSGLGYYSRARRLHSAARAIVERHDGVVPSDVQSLRALPGVGRYTAGAIASMVFRQREAVVDGNVQRVLVRLHAKELRLGVPETDRWAWKIAQGLVEACGQPGVLNEGLIELGATVCTPKGPKCTDCPVSAWCAAKRDGLQEELPRPKPRAKRREVWHGVAIVVEGDRVLLERRPETGLWAGLWAPPAVEREDHPPTPEEVSAVVGGTTSSGPEGFTHETTHRIVRFNLYRVEGGQAGDRGWFSLRQALALGISKAHARIVRLALEA